MTKDQTQDFLDSLPELRPGEEFSFGCHPDVSCFNACCGDLRLMLTPYDVLRLRRGLGKAGRDFLLEYCQVGPLPGSGFPGVRLRMMDDAKQRCPFVRAAGCSVYEHRPSACRTYPLGRATRMDEEGNLLEQYFVVQEPHCRGFSETTRWTGETWLKDQGLEAYHAWNDRYMSLVMRTKRQGMLDERRANMAVLALYQTDDFQRFVRDMRLFERIKVDEERQARIVSDEEAALGFGLDWLDLLINGQNDRVEKV